MKLSPVFVVGGVLVFVGAILFATQLFGKGGWAKSKQFRVIGELLRGVHGNVARVVVLVSWVLMPCGMCVLFGGLMASDGERRERCSTYCLAQGFTSGHVGPNSERVAGDPATVFVACICEGGGGENLEIEADSLMQE